MDDLKATIQKNLVKNNVVTIENLYLAKNIYGFCFGICLYIMLIVRW